MPSTEFLLGFVTSVVVCIAFILFMRKKTLKSGKFAKYDERQNVERGKCYKIAYFALLIYVAIYAGFVLTNPSLSQLLGPVGIFTGMFASIGLFAGLCIWKDAYEGINENKNWIYFFAFMAVVNFVIAGIEIVKYGFIDEGSINISCMNLEIGILFVVLLLVRFIKISLDKKED